MHTTKSHVSKSEIILLAAILLKNKLHKGMPHDSSRGVRCKKKIVVGVAVDRAYSEELKLSRTILNRVKLKAQHFLADGYYDSVKLIEYFEKERIKCVIAISETIRQGVRNAYRKLVKSRYEDDRYYRRIYKRGRHKVDKDMCGTL